MDRIDENGYRANVGIILIDNDSRVLIAGRRGRTGWQFPQGGVKRRESAEQAMYRELREEVGLSPGDVEIAGVTREWIRYRLPNKYVRQDCEPKCIGQKQRWFLLSMLADPAKLRFDATDEPEFDRCRWVDWWTPVEEVIYFKRKVYLRALTELAQRAFPRDGPPPQPASWPKSWRKA
ncbi:MAG: RNA pyrophosphohydrolase [Gammaproteobacteria bacterium]|nr:RNA pyrophosphohydrolase [Gammaproteobacteria bacterium]